MHISLDKIDRFIRVRGAEFRQLVLLDYNLFDKICDKIISQKSRVVDSINLSFGEIRNDSYDSLPIEKLLTFHNVIIHIK